MSVVTLEGRLSHSGVQSLESDGFLNVGEILGPNSFARVQEAVGAELRSHGERITRERDTNVVRGAHAGHLHNEVLADLVQARPLMTIAQQVLEDDVYIHQFKINAKAPFVGGKFEWHQDFHAWHHEDGMPTDRAVNIAISLDEVRSYSAPLMFIPGSHRDAVSATDRADLDGRGVVGTTMSLTDRMRFEIPLSDLARLVDTRGVVETVGPANSAVVFSPSIVHGSGTNMSPWSRKMLIITYNSVTNALREVESPRPEFVAARDYTPLELSNKSFQN